jgi:serine/threonine-protein kinase
MSMVSVGLAYGPVAAITSVTLLTVVAPFGAMVFAARKLLRRGFEAADLRIAFDHEIEVLREEFATAGLQERRGLERVAAAATGIFGLGTIAAMWAAGASVEIGMRPVLSVASPLLATATLASLLVRARLRARRPHSAPESWAKLWLGKVGRAAFALARRLGGRPVEGAATTHRATEMAIGMAASELFASLPRETRRALGDVPRIIDSLQHDAEVLRAHHLRLQESLADAGDAAADAPYADVRALRDELGERHREVVSTLERIRLDLLRLHAGAMSVDGVTTQVGLAGEVAQEVRRLLEARGELERFLKQ